MATSGMLLGMIRGQRTVKAVLRGRSMDTLEIVAKSTNHVFFVVLEKGTLVSVIVAVGCTVYVKKRDGHGWNVIAHKFCSIKLHLGLQTTEKNTIYIFLFYLFRSYGCGHA